MKKIIKILNMDIGWHLLQVFKVFVVVTMFMGMGFGGYMTGYLKGYSRAALDAGEEFSLFKVNLQNMVSSKIANAPTPTPKTVVIEKTKEVPVYSSGSSLDWGGPELWDAVNNRRRQLGVNAMGTKSELCTIASIRLNELLALGQLDGHEGFSNLAERRTDLAWIFEKYNISEFLVQGATSAEEAVSLWENTLGHSKLLTGGEYVWGCIYAQDRIGVAIAAY